MTPHHQQQKTDLKGCQSLHDSYSEVHSSGYWVPNIHCYALLNTSHANFDTLLDQFFVVGGEVSCLDVNECVLSRLVMHTLPIMPTTYFVTEVSFALVQFFRFAKCVTIIFFINKDFHD